MDDPKARGHASEVCKWSLYWDEIYSALKTRYFQEKEQ